MNWLPLIAALMAGSFVTGRLSVNIGKVWLSGYLHARQLSFLRPMGLRRK